MGRQRNGSTSTASKIAEAADFLADAAPILAREVRKLQEELAAADYALIMSNSDSGNWDDRARNALAGARSRQRTTGVEGADV